MSSIKYEDIIVELNINLNAVEGGLGDIYDVGRLLSFIERTPEGQALFRGVRNSKGKILISVDKDKSGSRFENNTLYINPDFIETVLVAQGDAAGRTIPNDGDGLINPNTGKPFSMKVFRPTLLRVLLHELFHAADPSAALSGPHVENIANDHRSCGTAQ